MICFSRDELRGYLLQELPAELQARIEQHVSSCASCCQTLDALTSDDLMRDYFEASRCDMGNGQTVETTSLSTKVGLEELPDWEPFTADASQLPLQFGKFVLKEVLGSGGFGVVYRAADVDLEREVAIKIPHLSGLAADVRRRFVQEGTAAARLHHPHIVQVHQSGTHRGICFLVSEYCPGRTLRQLLDETRGVRPVESAVRIVLLLVEAVAHAHQHGILHRDIKPANVILDDQNAGNGLPFCPKLTDFGTARLVGADQSLTASGMLIGTAPYMAPEQVSGGPEVGPACDVYSLGVLLYELIADQLPIQGSDSADMIQNVVCSEVVSLHRIVPGVPRDLSAICARCLEKSPRRRYKTAHALASDLRRFLAGEPTIARPLGPGNRLVRWSRRNPLPLTIMGTIALVFALVVSGLAWHTSRLTDLNDQLTTSNQRAVELKDRAEQSEVDAQRLRYASDIRLAEQTWREGDFRSTRDIVARYEPEGGKLDLRGVEWYFLKRAVRKNGDTIAAYGSALNCIRFSPDDETFVTAGEDGIIRLHDRATGALRQSIASQQGEVNSVAFSPDGQTLASAGDDGSIRLWRLADGAQLDYFSAHDGLAFGVEFMPDGQHLVTWGSDQLVHVWKDGRKELTHQDHAWRVEATAVSPDGRWLASAGKDGTLIVRDVRSGELHFRLNEGHVTLSSAAFAPDSKTVAIAETSGETTWLRLFDLDAKAEILTRQHPDGIRFIAFSADGDRVLTTDNAGTVRVWDASSTEPPQNASAEPLETWRAHHSRAYSAVFEPYGESVLSVGQDGQVRRLYATEPTSAYVLDRRHLGALTGKPEDYLRFHRLAFHSNDWDLLVIASIGIAVVKTDSNNATEYFDQTAALLWDCLTRPREGDWIAVAGSTSMHETENGRRIPAEVHRRKTPTGPPRVLFRTRSNSNIRDLSCSPSGDMLAVVVDDQLVHDGPRLLLLLDSQSGSILREFPAARGTKPRFTEDGRWLLYGVQQEIHLVGLRHGEHRVIQNAHRDSQNGMSVSRDGRWLATSGGRELRIWNVATLRRHADLKGHQGTITALEFSSDSATLFSSSSDGTVKAWSVAAGQLLMDLHLGKEGVSHMALSADGERLALIENGERVLVYQLGDIGR